MHVRSNFIAPVLFALALAVGVIGCGSSSTTVTSSGQTIHHCSFFVKVKIVAHLGVAYVAFHSFIYKPWQEGKFRKGAPGRKKAIVEGVIAALVGIHEAQHAVKDLKLCGAGDRVSSLLSSAESHLNQLRNVAPSASTSRVNSQVQGLANTMRQIQTAGTH